jgi:hypothetical protein
MRAFIIRPFGTKQGINFDRVEAELIDPALTALDIAGRTTGEILQAGNIRTDMFQQLLVADLVIADISTNNANAFYELGIRHALRDCHTFLLRSRKREPVHTADLAKDEEDRKKNEDVPFDLLTDRYLAYDPDNPAAVLETLIKALRSTTAGYRPDSPVFLALPGLETQEQSCFTPVPQGFGDELDIAAQKRQRERLALLGIEARGFTWETAGLRAVGRKQFDLKYFADALSTWESVLKNHPDDLEASTLLGTIYQRLAELEKSNTALRRVIARPNVRPARLAEAHALLGRNLKQLWQDEWKQAPPEDRRRCALESPLLLEAYQQYKKAYFQDLNAYYPGINALGLLTVYLDLSGPDADEELRAEASPLTAAVGLSIEAAKAQQGGGDIWLKITGADLRLFTAAKPAEAVAAYRTALWDAPPFAKESAARQLELFRDLAVMQDKVPSVLATIATTTAKQQTSAGPDHVILFTGHRIDSPDRKTPRFPAVCETKAREAIRSALCKIRNAGTGQLLGVAGAACGGDILFHEVCKELGIRAKVCLALPPDKYIEASVQPDWVERFHLVVGDDAVAVLADDGKLPAWLTDKPSYSIWQRNNLWELCTALAFDAKRLTLIALWDGQKGDGLGGTEDMVGIARKRGADVQIISVREVCA